MLLERGFKIARFALLASFGFYVLILFIDYVQAGDPAAMLWGAGATVVGMVISTFLCVGFWMAVLVRRRKES
jgi:hypothetical protein